MALKAESDLSGYIFVSRTHRRQIREKTCKRKRHVPWPPNRSRASSKKATCSNIWNLSFIWHMSCELRCKFIPNISHRYCGSLAKLRLLWYLDLQSTTHRLVLPSLRPKAVLRSWSLDTIWSKRSGEEYLIGGAPGRFICSSETTWTPSFVFC